MTYTGELLDGMIKPIFNFGNMPKIPRQSRANSNFVDPAMAYSALSLGVGIDIADTELEIESNTLTIPKHKRLVSEQSKDTEEIEKVTLSGINFLVRYNLDALELYPYFKFTSTTQENDNKTDYTQWTAGIQYNTEQDSIRYFFFITNETKRWKPKILET